MMVELAVCLPVMLAIAGIAINLMVFFGDCARFDRVAAEAVRTQAASPGYGSYGTDSRAQDVRAVIEGSFVGSDHLSFSVSAGGVGEGSSGSSEGGSDAPTFSLTPHLEEYTCTLYYRPWGLGDSFFGIQFSGIPHTRTFVIDPYKPGVFL